MQSIEAYLDDYNRLTVEISNDYYGGNCDFFTIIDEDSFIIGNKIEEKIRKYTGWSYCLTLDSSLDFSKEYVVVASQGYRATLMYRGVVMTKRFEEEFYYDGNDLGAVVKDDKTVFKCWAPTATKMSLFYEINDETKFIQMKRGNKGVFEGCVDKNLHNVKYVYHVYVNGTWNQTLDPYGKSSDCNGKHSVVIDTQHLLNKSTKHVVCENPTNAVLYEASVRDMTSSSSASTREKGNFNALCEMGTKWNELSTGFDHVVELGITHLQLLPVCDFVTIEEAYPKLLYNWGYDPNQYMALEGSYSSNPSDGFVRCDEFINMVNCFHNKNIGIIMDVVFNHHYDHRLSSFDKCVPYYYFRYHPDFKNSNGSFCGNDIESRRKMVRKYIIDTCLYFSEVYKIDGFRFDLMGIIDVETMRQLYKALKKINPSALLYGEGWDMPTAVSENDKAMIKNSLSMPGVGCFNDMIRDVLKGKATDNNHRGYITGNLWLQTEMRYVMGDCRYTRQNTCFDHPNVSINYVECHDNRTLWDKIESCYPTECEEKRKKRHKLCIGLVILAQGVPFIHAGQEMCRTKLNHDNTYNMADEINEIDWQLKDIYFDVFKYTKDVIELRKKYRLFQLSTLDDCLQCVTVEFDEGLMIYKINDSQKISNMKELIVVANPTDQDYVRSYESYTCIFNEQGKCFEKIEKDVRIKSCSLMIFIK